MIQYSDRDKQNLRRLILIFIGLAAGIILTGILLYRNQELSFKNQMAHQLEAVADLKVSEISGWKKERYADANVIYKNNTFTRLVRQYLNNPQEVSSRVELQSWIQRIQENNNYDRVYLLDILGNERISSPNWTEISCHEVQQLIPEVIQYRQIMFHDFHRDSTTNIIHMGYLVPILDPSRNDEPIAILSLRVNPETYLYPYIQRWPSPSKTAETLIVRREGNDVLFLNELRFTKNAALRNRIPLSRTQVAGVMAVLGKEGVFDAFDYRGVRVLAAIRKIPDSPWYLVARMDNQEIYAPLREKLIGIIILVLAFITSAAAGLGMIWRQQRMYYYEEQSRVAVALKENENRLRMAEAVGHLGHWSMDLKTMSMSWSDEMYCIHGITRKTSLHAYRDILKFIHPEDTEKYERVIETVKKDEKSDFEYRILRPSGELRYISGNARLIQDEKNYPIAMFGTILDATELRQKERELQEKNIELERFTYTISHDLKSPVVTVKTFLGYLEQDMSVNNTERIQKDIHFIRTATTKMSQLLEELLEMSRIGRVINPPVRVPFKELVEEALSTVAGEIANRKVEVHIEDYEVVLTGDRPRLVEIWQNLLENAIKFMGDQPAPRIEIGVERINLNTVFFVRDNGAGVDPRYQEKIFRLFEKLDPKIEGSGLGLALIKRIIEFYRGIIWVESVGLGQGTCFRFTLPDAVKQNTKGD